MATEDNYLYFRRNNEVGIFNFTSISMPISMHLFCNDSIQIFGILWMAELSEIILTCG
jgi:hypothetical protein